MRRAMESAVLSVNKHLEDVVQSMDYVEMLRNSHPMYRRDHARALHRNGAISEYEMKKFTKE